MREKEKLLQELIVKSQQEALEKKRLEEQAKQDRIAKIKERQRRREAAAIASASDRRKNPGEKFLRVPVTLDKHSCPLCSQT